MLSLRSVETFYGKIKVIMGISMELKGGDVVAIVGANGAGKTTLLKTIMGITPAEYGEVEFQGKRIEDMDPYQVTRLGISLVPEGRMVFTDLTVKENLEMGAFIRKDQDKIKGETERMLSIFPNLQKRLTQKGNYLSGGEQQMLAIARALMCRPKLLLLDEPSLGLSPLLVKEVFLIIDQIHREGTPILLVEQNIMVSMKIADFAYIMENGRMRLSGTPEKILKDQDVREFYLGEGKGRYVSRKDRWKGKM